MLISVVLIVTITIFLISACFIVEKSNKIQYRLLVENYQLSLLTELASLELHKELASQQIVDDFLYPSELEYSIGTVHIDYNEQTQVFLVKATLKNGQEKQEEVHVTITPVEKKVVKE